VEKSLVDLNLISKDVTFCADYEFNLFCDALSQADCIKRISDSIFENPEDIWFDLYKSITNQRELAENLVER
jgi:hypothetical protein